MPSQNNTGRQFDKQHAVTLVATAILAANRFIAYDGGYATAAGGAKDSQGVSEQAARGRRGAERGHRLQLPGRGRGQHRPRRLRQGGHRRQGHRWHVRRPLRPRPGRGRRPASWSRCRSSSTSTPDSSARMNYATVQDMVDRFGERELVQLTDSALLAVQAAPAERALADAQALADGFVGRVYRLPLAGCTKPTPTELDPARHSAGGRRPSSRASCATWRATTCTTTWRPSTRCTCATRPPSASCRPSPTARPCWPAPGGTPGTLVAGDAPGDGEVRYEFSPRQITDDSLRGFG